MIRPLPHLTISPLYERILIAFVAAVCFLLLCEVNARAEETLPQLVTAVKSAWHIPHSWGDVLADLALLTLCLGLANNIASALANKVPDKPGIGHWIHVVALNIGKTASTVKAVDAFALEMVRESSVASPQNATPVPPPGEPSVTPPPA